ncbi:MAG: beta-mannosidase [Cytophagaceae bacterium]
MNTTKNLLSLIIFSFSIIIGGCSEAPKEKIKLEVNNNWKFRIIPSTSNPASIDTSWMPATVPGTVHTDLFINRQIPDPFYRDNEKLVQWIEKAEWEYKININFNKAILNKNNIEITFEGLDTYANVYLNDSLIISADNMFISHNTSIKNFIRSGDNELRVHFLSPVNTAMDKLHNSPYLVPAHNEIAPINERTSVFTRKAPFHYGWDWGPRLVTSGIWRSVYITGWDNGKIENTHVITKGITNDKAILELKAEIIADKKTQVELLLKTGNNITKSKKISLEKGVNHTTVDFEIENPKLWWSNGLGDPNLYTVDVCLLKDNTIIDSITATFGIRKIEVVQENDQYGKSFYIKLNNIPVFMKGTNYIPGNIFTPSVTTQDYQKVIQTALDANMNMIRVWGGAIYENDFFYELCDKNGILVWQDFMFACSMIPEDSLHLENLKNEFEQNIKRLRNHPSLALYCGNNENMIAWFNWGWKDIYKYSTQDSINILNTYRKVMYHILPTAIKEHDPQRFYWPSSPSSGYEYNELPDKSSGDVHDWGVWFAKFPFEEYKNTMGRFVSEYGMQSFPDMKTIRSFSVPDDWDVRSPLMEFKQRSLMPWISKDMNGNEMIREYVKMYYKLPDTFENFVYTSQLMQAMGLKTAIEAHRRNMPYCMGSLYWQINDCWPTVSWSTVDYYYRYKAAHYAVKDAFQEIIIAPEVKNDKLNIYVVSDRLNNFSGKLKFTIMDFKGNKLSEKTIPAEIKGNSSNIYYTVAINDFLTKENKNKIFATISLSIENTEVCNNIFYFDKPKNLALPLSIPNIKVEKESEKYKITINADNLIKNLYLYTLRSEGHFTNNYFDVVPGKTLELYFIPSKENINLENDIYTKHLSGIYR